MNIKTATEQVEGAIRAYLARDERGGYLIPPEMQRPLMLMGPPGVGKTAIVGQVAERLGINFVSYSITHHTRQSALGLPYITEASYGGKTYRVSRYTMSEIIAGTYDAMEETGIREGVLFLDEVNCVSETLAPAMLQFLQYKTFGQHRLPAGWVVVCAGNPPEYNRSAREFDPAMLDRLKRIDVEPDLEVWQGYAVEHGVHPAITTYLTSKPDSFFHIQASVDGTRMVTARGWEDLSRMLVAYGQVGLKPDRDLVGQYLQDPDIAEDFSLYLELFEKYQDDYKVDDILAGTADASVAARAKAAPFDERIALVGLLVSALSGRARRETEREDALKRVREDILAARERCGQGESAAQALAELSASAAAELARASSRVGTSEGRRGTLAERSELLRQVAQAAAGASGDGLSAARERFNAELAKLSEEAKGLAAELDAAAGWLEDAFDKGEELVVFCTRVACDPDLMRLASAYGAPRLVEASQGLMFHDQQHDLLERVSQLEGIAPEGSPDAATP